MVHFSEEAWIDFVRGISPSSAKTGQAADSRSEMESHLASGCSDCKEAFKLWQQVYGITSRGSEYCPPEHAVRMTKVAFAARQLRSSAETLAASLVFDSFSRPVLAGARSVTTAARQMVYDAGGLTVDLRFDRKPKSNRLQLIGQVLDAERTDTVLANLPVVLCNHQSVLVADGHTNQFGEFHLEFDAQNELKLAIWINAGKVIRIALANVGQVTAAQRFGSRPDIGNQW